MSKILLYKIANQEIELEVLIHNDTIWLNQKAVVAKNATTASDGKVYNDREILQDKLYVSDFDDLVLKLDSNE